MKKLSACVALLLLLACAAAGEDRSADLKFTILKDTNGKPVRNASVVLHPVDKHGKMSREGVQLKTDGEGKAEIRGISYGKMRVQVLAKGLQTYGEDYDINKPAQEFTIRLKPPQEQYSIYK